MEELFAALESPLLGYALKLVGERSAAEDIVQDAFMKLHAHRNEVREPRPWLYRTVHNLALNARRETAKIVPFASPLDSGSATDVEAGFHGHTDADATDPSLLPDEQILRGERIGLVRDTLQVLDARSRRVVQLKFDENLSYQQISERTGLTSGHVGYLLHHALKTMAAELAHAGLLS